MYTGWKKAAVIGLSAGLVLAGLSGCSREEFNAEAAAVTVNDDTISAGLLRSPHGMPRLSTRAYIRRME